MSTVRSYSLAVNSNTRHAYYRIRWPDAEVPAGEPLWLHYEVSHVEDAVLRTVDVFPDGSIARNSVELEQRHGHGCPSLIDCSVAEAFDQMDVEEISAEAFNALWLSGVDKPHWFVR